jgi:hypothetical protein
MRVLSRSSSTKRSLIDMSAVHVVGYCGRNIIFEQLQRHSARVHSSRQRHLASWTTNRFLRFEPESDICRAASRYITNPPLAGFEHQNVLGLTMSVSCRTTQPQALRTQDFLRIHCRSLHRLRHVAMAHGIEGHVI